MKIFLTTMLVVVSVLLAVAALFVCYFKITRKITWREAVGQAISDILM